MEAATKAGGDFSICFYPYNRKGGCTEGRVAMKTYEHCTMRRPLPHEKWEVDGKNYFLFNDSGGRPKACHRCLIRFIALSVDNYTLKKVRWYE